MNKNVAIIVPHGDDEVLGFGGVIQKHIKNKDEVSVIFTRKPIDERTQIQFNDIDNAKNLLGYHKKYCLGMSEIEMSHEPITLFRRMEKILKLINPEIVYTTFWGDIHQDHKITYEWACRAVRVWGPLNVKQFFVGEIPSSTDQYPTISGISFTPNYYVPLTEDELKIKIDALECYGTETCKYPHPRSRKGIISKSEIRGQECGNEYAESFINLRYII
jgi:LmbE family N-acetylglucosaminyl deacetylase